MNYQNDDLRIKEIKGFELELQLVSAGKEAGFELLNSLGEKVKIYLDASEAVSYTHLGCFI